MPNGEETEYDNQTRRLPEWKPQPLLACGPVLISESVTIPPRKNDQFMAQKGETIKIKLTNCGFTIVLVPILGWLLTVPVLGQTNSIAGSQQSSDDQMAEIARKLNNPISALISVPIQNNFDFGGGPNGDGFQYTVKLQPIIPFSLNEKWNLITRTIIPFIYQANRIGNTSQSGLGDSTLSLFFSPKKPGPGGLIWAVGPDFYFPTATESVLGTQKWGLGPTAVVVEQRKGWTYGMLINHIWSIAGDDNRQAMSSTLLQPSLSYQTRTRTTFGISSEASYDWENTQWTVPLNATVTQVLRIGKVPVSFQFGGRYYADKPAGGPDWGLRFTVTLVFSK